MAVGKTQFASQGCNTLRNAQAHTRTIVGRKGVALDAVDIVETACGRTQLIRGRTLHAIARAKGPAELQLLGQTVACHLGNESVGGQGVDGEANMAAFEEFVFDEVARPVLAYGTLVQPAALLTARYAQAERAGPLVEVEGERLGCGCIGEKHQTAQQWQQSLQKMVHRSHDT